jgi:hypothetical protein
MTKRPGNYVSIQPLSSQLFSEIYDFSEANALLGGIGIVFINDPLPPSSAYRFSALISVMLRGRIVRSPGFEMIFPKQIDRQQIGYEFGPGGHFFSYEGPFKVNQIILDDLKAFPSFNSTYSYEFVSKDSEVGQMFSFTQKEILSELRIKEGVTISFKSASETEA